MAESALSSQKIELPPKRFCSLPTPEKSTKFFSCQTHLRLEKQSMPALMGETRHMCSDELHPAG